MSRRAVKAAIFVSAAVAALSLMLAVPQWSCKSACVYTDGGFSTAQAVTLVVSLAVLGIAIPVRVHQRRADFIRKHPPVDTVQLPR
jgi:hypothetical protein